MNNTLFLQHCKNDDVESAKTIYQSGVIGCHDINEAINKSVDNFNVLLWLCGLAEANPGNIIILFSTSCGLGRHALVKFMLEKIAFPKYIIKCGMIVACSYGQLEIMKLLYSDNLGLKQLAYFQSVTGKNTNDILSENYEVFTGPHTGSESCFKSVYDELCAISNTKKTQSITDWLNTIKQ